MIHVQNLVKNFGPKRAVNGISFEVQKGEVLGFLGPNGAGKSTTMRMITGFIPPTEGRVTIGGHDIDPIFDVCLFTPKPAGCPNGIPGVFKRPLPVFTFPFGPGIEVRFQRTIFAAGL